jgi:hypothetical protein
MRSASRQRSPGGRGTVVIGNQGLWRVALGNIDQVGEELRRAVGNLAAVEFTAHRPAIIWIGGERVRVASSTEAKDAERIMKLLTESYGVAFDSVAARRAARQDKAERGASADKVRRQEPRRGPSRLRELFFTAPDTLKRGIHGKKRGEWGNACPKRFWWIEAEVARWTSAR